MMGVLCLLCRLLAVARFGLGVVVNMVSVVLVRQLLFHILLIAES